MVTIITNNPPPTFPGLPPGLLVAECLYVLATRQAHILFRNNYDVCVRVVMTSTETHPFVTANTLWWQFTLHTRYQLVDCFSVTVLDSDLVVNSVNSRSSDMEVLDMNTNSELWNAAYNYVLMRWTRLGLNCVSVWDASRFRLSVATKSPSR